MNRTLDTRLALRHVHIQGAGLAAILLRIFPGGHTVLEPWVKPRAAGRHTVVEDIIR